VFHISSVPLLLLLTHVIVASLQMSHRVHGPAIMHNCARWLQTYSSEADRRWDVMSWPRLIATDIPIQFDASSCGLFALM